MDKPFALISSIASFKDELMKAKALTSRPRLPTLKRMATLPGHISRQL